jgi:undecaprenyl-diphosphatase
MSLDANLSKRIYEGAKSREEFWEFLSLYGGYGFVFYFFGVLAATWGNWNLPLRFLLGAIVTAGILLAIRLIIRRPRPGYRKNDYNPWLERTSFPSGHASMMFFFAVNISLSLLALQVYWFTLISSAVLILLAVLISVSRVAMGVHYLTDISAGAALGSGIAILSFILTL